jgi:hypothetical protein
VGLASGLSLGRRHAGVTFFKAFITHQIRHKEPLMKVMVIVKANKDSEAGKMPSQQLLTEMGKFNEELVKAGVMLAGEGLHPTSKGVRVGFRGNERTVTTVHSPRRRS